MDDEIRALAHVDRLVHEPARLLILTVLTAVAKADFNYLLRETGLTRGNLSSHLSRLEEAGYVSIEKTYKGKVPLTLCRMTETGEGAFADYRRTMAGVVGQSQSGESS